MTLHRKANHTSHCFCSPSLGASVRRRTPVEGLTYDNFVAVGNENRSQVALCDGVPLSRTLLSGMSLASNMNGAAA